jgi:dTDP-4-amino-4,6-dideoxygalactose transaminase
MVDLQGQYHRLESEVDAAIKLVLKQGDFIQGSAVKEFENELSRFLGGAYVISCGNGTDALQIAMMALGFKPGDEVILPVHTYVATAEVIALLGLVPVFADVDPRTFNLDVSQLEKLTTSKTVAIVPVHLYGQCADMEPILSWAKSRNLQVIEDAAQSLGAEYIFKDKSRKMSGTMGVIGTTSFFPTKNLGAYGDGGALMTHDDELAEKIRMIANHGQKKKYHHEVVGVNSRLDTLQAAILRVKLKCLDEFMLQRQAVAAWYDLHLSDVPFLQTPIRSPWSTHVFHQYTIITKGISRDALKAYLQEKGIPAMIYYPVPLHLQEAYRRKGWEAGTFPVTERLSETVLSLPIHTEMDEEQLAYICRMIQAYS